MNSRVNMLFFKKRKWGNGDGERDNKIPESFFFGVSRPKRALFAPQAGVVLIHIIFYGTILYTLSTIVLSTRPGPAGSMTKGERGCADNNWSSNDHCVCVARIERESIMVESQGRRDGSVL